MKGPRIEYRNRSNSSGKVIVEKVNIENTTFLAAAEASLRFAGRVEVQKFLIGLCLDLQKAPKNPHTIPLFKAFHIGKVDLTLKNLKAIRIELRKTDMDQKELQHLKNRLFKNLNGLSNQLIAGKSDRTFKLLKKAVKENHNKFLISRQLIPSQLSAIRAPQPSSCRFFVSPRPLPTSRPSLMQVVRNLFRI